MNQVWQKSLKFHFKHLYYGESTLDAQELQRALLKLPQTNTNRFPIHALRNKRQENQSGLEDNITFQELNDRILRTIKDPKDSLFLDAFFELADQDQDGFITYDQLTRLAHELSTSCMSEKAFAEMAEKLSSDGGKFSKDECIEFLKGYL